MLYTGTAGTGAGRHRWAAALQPTVHPENYVCPRSVFSTPPPSSYLSARCDGWEIVSNLRRQQNARRGQRCMLRSVQLLRLPRTRGLASSTAELLHSSRIPTLHFQDSLPKLPVPTLKATLKRLLTSAEPLVSAAELAETHRLVADFEYGGAGELLQAQLIAKDQLRYSSFISEPWFDMYLTDIDPTPAPARAPAPAPALALTPAPILTRYLTDRAPLLLNYNPALCFHDDPGAAGSQVGRAARLVHASMTFLRTLETSHLEPDI